MFYTHLRIIMQLRILCIILNRQINPSVSIFEVVFAALYTIKTVFEKINNTLP